MRAQAIFWRLETFRALVAMTMLLATAVVTMAASAATANAAHYRRNDCFSYGSAGDRGRQMGERNALRLFNALWGRMGRNCANLDRLATVISDTPLARPAGGGIMAACFYQGYVETLFNQLDGASGR